MNKKRMVAVVVFPILAAGLLFLVSNGWGWICDNCPPVLSGRMTGGGSFFTGQQELTDFGVPLGTRVTHGFEVHCDVTDQPNNLQFDVHNPDGKDSRFHLDQLTFALCWDDPAINPKPPDAPFDSIYGQGLGRYNGEAGFCADFEFTDAGEPGTNDTVRDLRIWKPTVAGNCSDGTYVFGTRTEHKLTDGNHQAHKDNK